MKKIFSIFLHLAALGIILALWFPILKFFNDASPPMGADFLQYPTFVAQLKNDFKIPPMSWKYIWYGGAPSIFDNAWLHFYLTLPLTSFLSVVNASRVYISLTMVAQAVFSYLLFFELSGSLIVSSALAFGVISSVDFYIGVFDGGTATYHATKMFLPLTLLLLVKYFKTKKKKFLLLAGLAIGFSALGHAGSFSILMLGPAVLFSLAQKDENSRIFSFAKIKDSIILTTITLLVGAVTLYPIFYLMLDFKKGGTAWAQFGLTTKVQSDALVGLFENVNPYLWGLFLLLGLLLILRKKLKEAVKATSFFVLLLYVFFSCFLFLIGHHPISQALGPGRIWWVGTLALAGLVAVFWQIIFPKEEGKTRLAKMMPSILASIIFIPIFLSFQLPNFKTNFKKHNSQNGYPSTAMPAVIRGDKEEVKKIVAPSWLDTETKNYRFYEITPGIITWWNSVFPLPILKGYYGIMTSKVNDWNYWVDQVILGEYVWHFKVPEAIAKQHALFLIDWYAIRYLDMYGLPLADYLEKDPGVVEIEAVLNEENSEPLYPQKLFDNITSPIVKPTNVPAVLLVGNTVAYDTLLKLLASENLNSRYLVPIHGPEYIEDLAKMNLDDFDVIFLYSFKYKNEKDFRARPEAPWKKLEDWVKKGGKLIIETGGETVESDSSLLAARKLSKLPSVFPIETTKIEELGTEWDLKVNNETVMKGVEKASLSPLVYESSVWKLSYASGPVRSWAKVVLSQRGKPILVEGKLGEGKVVWSGMNLPYHFIYYLNLEEANLFKNILAEMVPLQREEDFKGVSVQRIDNEHLQIVGKGFNGIIFKENYWGGWGGRLLSPKNVKLNVYRAGPYFMYVRLPKGTTGDLKVNVTYNGIPIGWFLFILSVLTTVFVLFIAFFGEGLKKKLNLKVISDEKTGAKGRLSSWWGREEE